ncbi:peptide ABC transporter substrate-binding protein [Paenibacillus durus]|uniref:peptide ABC transporter substrate-binding protein n=1 Tax=Paenibacillus durus TaxID=44251 RepID=UPI00046E8613|nr:peptide ABC transporter substrate-binding protein [Paenibacillus durus]
MKKKIMIPAAVCFLAISICLVSLAWGAPREQIFRFNLYTNPISLDPALSYDSTSDEVLNGVFEGLVRTSRNGGIEPAMAKSWTVSQDGRTYTFKLRGDAAWSNKQKVKASDFEYAWKRVLNPATSSPHAYMLYYLAGGEAYHNGTLKNASKVGVQAVNDTTLKVTLRSRTPYFLQLAASRAYLPVNPSVVKSNKNWAMSAKSLVGNGSFTLTKWVPDQEIVLSKNRFYPEAKKIHFDQIKMGIINDPVRELAMYKQGQLDWSGPSETNINVFKLDKATKKDVHTYNPASTYYYVFNVTKPPFDNVNIRRALGMAISREMLTHGTPAYAFVPPGIRGAGKTFREEASGAPYFKEDADKARELLKKGMKEEGLSAFPETKLIFNEGHEYISSAVTSMWADNLGIDVYAEVQPWEELLDNRMALNFEIARAGWTADYNDPASFLEMFASWSTDNDSGWHNAEYDSYIRQAQQTGNDAVRMKLYHQAERLLIDQMVIIPVHYFKEFTLQKPYVHGVYKDYSGALVYRDGYLK